MSLDSLGAMAALWNSSVAYSTTDIISYNDSEWVSFGDEDAPSVDREKLVEMVSELFQRQVGVKIKKTPRGVIVDTTHGEGAPAPEISARPHTEQVFPFEEV